MKGSRGRGGGRRAFKSVSSRGKRCFRRNDPYTVSLSLSLSLSLTLSPSISLFLSISGDGSAEALGYEFTEDDVRSVLAKAQVSFHF